jgi:hypothetical protein
MSESEREYEEGAAGTDPKRKNDPLKEYSDKEAMTPAKIKSHEPTAVQRDPSDQKIVGEKQDSTYEKGAAVTNEGVDTGTETEEAKKEYQKRGMTKVE